MPPPPNQGMCLKWSLLQLHGCHLAGPMYILGSLIANLHCQLCFIHVEKNKLAGEFFFQKKLVVETEKLAVETGFEVTFCG